MSDLWREATTETIAEGAVKIWAVRVKPDYEAAEAEYLKWSLVDDEQDIEECRRQARLVVDAAYGGRR